VIDWFLFWWKHNFNFRIECIPRADNFSFLGEKSLLLFIPVKYLLHKTIKVVNYETFKHLFVMCCILWEVKLQFEKSFVACWIKKDFVLKIQNQNFYKFVVNICDWASHTCSLAKFIDLFEMHFSQKNATSMQCWEFDEINSIASRKENDSHEVIQLFMNVFCRYESRVLLPLSR